MLKFRYLRADEVECRVAQCNKNGVSILLYKDARVDQRLLDETVGAYNWQKTYSRDNANCTVSIWDESKKQWISKEDTGTESNTEAEKGLASDSFKRACFCWGIGRELYTAPFIWIPANLCNVTEGRNGKPACYDRFKCTHMEVVDGNIVALEIVNTKRNAVVFSWGTQPAPRAQTPEKTEEDKNRDLQAQAHVEKIDATKIKVIKDQIAAKRLNNNSILQHYKLDRFEDMTLAQWTDAMHILEQY